jgi:hypothetical protein
MAYLTVLYAASQYIQMCIPIQGSVTFRGCRRATAPPTVYLLSALRRHSRAMMTRAEILSQGPLRGKRINQVQSSPDTHVCDSTAHKATAQHAATGTSVWAPAEVTRPQALEGLVTFEAPEYLTRSLMARWKALRARSSKPLSLAVPGVHSYFLHSYFYFEFWRNGDRGHGARGGDHGPHATAIRRRVRAHGEARLQPRSLRTGATARRTARSWQTVPVLAAAPTHVRL